MGIELALLVFDAGFGGGDLSATVRRAQWFVVLQQRDALKHGAAVVQLQQPHVFDIAVSLDQASCVVCATAGALSTLSCLPGLIPNQIEYMAGRNTRVRIVPANVPPISV